MKEIFSSYIGFFMIAMSLIIGVNIMTATITARNAHLDAQNYVQEIEASNMASSVISAVKAEAAEEGYTLEIEELGTSDYKYGKLHLTYTYSIPIAHISLQKTITKDIY